VIQGFKLDADALMHVGEVPDGETVISLPEELVRLLPKEHDASPSPHPPDKAAASAGCICRKRALPPFGII
jgi:hypothetical protein